MNKIILSGRITKDIELQTFGDTKVVNNTIAVYGGTDTTHFFDFKAFGFNADRLKEHATKGSKIVIEGNLRQDKWEKDNEKFSKVMIYVDSVEIMSGSTEENTPQNVKDKVKGVADSKKIDDDSLPF